MKKRRNPLLGLEFSSKSTADLRGRQSVRTTFKLSERSIHALSILACQMGIKQKSLFDHLIDDMQALRIIANEVEEYERKTHRIAKTFVISRRTLENLEQVSSQFKTPRDALVELSIERIIPLVKREKEKHAQRIGLQEELLDYLNQGMKLYAKAETKLGKDDPVCVKLLSILRGVEHGYRDIEIYVEKGRKMEDF